VLVLFLNSPSWTLVKVEKTLGIIFNYAVEPAHVTTLAKMLSPRQGLGMMMGGMGHALFSPDPTPAQFNIL
jgi:hypothetical protein